MEKIMLKAEIREGVGKSSAKRIRKEKKIPVVCYKSGKKGLNLKVESKELYHVLHTKAGERVLITLDINDTGSKKKKTVIVKEIQSDPVKGEIMHVDFNEVSLTQEIKVRVPIATHGEAKKVVKEGGIIEHIIWELEIECLPDNIPEKIQVEIAEMEIGDIVHVKELNIPEGVKVLSDPEGVVLTAKPPAKEEETAETTEAEEGTEPEVIAKGKKPEDEEDEQGEDKPSKGGE